MTTLSSEQAALTALLERNHDGAAAWDALARDGWLDLVPDRSSWALASVAATVAGTAGVYHPQLAVGAHLAATAVLPAAAPRARRMGVVTDLAGDGESMTGTAWGAEADAYVGWLPDQRVVSINRTDIEQTASPMLFLEDASVCRIAVAGSSINIVEGADPPECARAQVAFILAAEATAVATAATSRTGEYLAQRFAFGRPLAGQQVLQHRVVDMRLACLTGSALLERAATEWTDGARPRSSWAAKLHAGQQSVWTIEQAIQLHGGIGFTEELGIASWLRIAQRCRLLMGGQTQAAREVLESVSPAITPQPRDWALDFDPGMG